jgi:hypothetical protein
MLEDLTRQFAACKNAAAAIADLEFARRQKRPEDAAELLVVRATALARRGDIEGAFATAEAFRSSPGGVGRRSCRRPNGPRARPARSGASRLWARQST